MRRDTCTCDMGVLHSWEGKGRKNEKHETCRMC